MRSPADIITMLSIIPEYSRRQSRGGSKGHGNSYDSTDARLLKDPLGSTGNSLHRDHSVCRASKHPARISNDHTLPPAALFSVPSCTSHSESVPLLPHIERCRFNRHSRGQGYRMTSTFPRIDTRVDAPRGAHTRDNSGINYLKTPELILVPVARH